MKAVNRRFIAAIATALAFAATAVSQAVVVKGTGDPNLDVPAVQAAVDQGGSVVLMGHFSFDRPPNKPAGAINGRMVTVSKEVVISGTRDEHGEMTTLEGGYLPFEVDALGAHVTIQRLRFIRPKQSAISVYAVSGLVIAYCRIEGVEPEPFPAIPTGIPLGVGINVNTVRTGKPPRADYLGQPESVSGTLYILNNDIDVGGAADAHTLGIVVFSVGKYPDKEVHIYISGNNIRNTTERSINLYHVGGRARIERNVITTGAIAAPISGVAPDVIHITGSGSYLIAHNSIDCAWATGAGIRVHGNPGLGEVIARAIIVDNDVTMSAPEGTVFGDVSAGIDIRGFAQGNVVLNNRIRGRARAALTVIGQGRGIPGNNTLVLNDFTGFKPSLADVFVGAGVTNTLVFGRQGAVEDHGVSTLIVAAMFLGKLLPTKFRGTGHLGFLIPESLKRREIPQ